jgi:hypothetical protein
MKNTVFWPAIFFQTYLHVCSHIKMSISLFLVGWDSLLGSAATTGLLYRPQMIDDGDCGAIGGLKMDRVNRSTRRKPAAAPLCPLQIPHYQTRARTRAAAVGSQRLTPWAMARPKMSIYLKFDVSGTPVASVPLRSAAQVSLLRYQLFISRKDEV